MTDPHAAAPAAPAPAEPKAATVIDFNRLPKHLQHLLLWHDPKEWMYIEARVCHLPMTRDLADAVSFLDRIWTHAGRAEYWTGKNRITGSEMDIYRERFDDAVRKLLASGVELARRTGLTEILGRNRRLLDRHGVLDSVRPAGPVSHKAQVIPADV
jgi:hypothetical protein